MLNKALDLIDKLDIDSLIQNAVSESKSLEYKEELPNDTSDSKKEFLADVSSFANSSGGDLIYGIKELRDEKNKSTGMPDKADGLNINFDSEIRRLENMLRDSIEPRIIGINFKVIEGFPEGSIIIIRIPKTWNSPHMVKSSSRFYARNNAGKYPLDVTEIRSAFIASESLAERLRQFRTERIAKIIADETPVLLEPNPKIVLHSFPISSFTTGTNIDLNFFTNNSSSLKPIYSSSWNHRYNFDGFVAHSTNDGKVSFSYTQLFRNGAIEAVESRLLRPHNGETFIPSVAYEVHLIQSLQEYLELQKKLELLPPVFIMLSLLGVKGYSMSVNNYRFYNTVHPIDRDIVLIPEIIVDDYATNASDILRPAFDVIWQACGWNCCQNYDPNGNWIGNRR